MKRLLSFIFLPAHEVFLSVIKTATVLASPPLPLILPIYYTQVFLAIKRPTLTLVERQEPMMQAGW
jgi:hypothetical protein